MRSTNLLCRVGREPERTFVLPRLSPSRRFSRARTKGREDTLSAFGRLPLSRTPPKPNVKHRYQHDDDQTDQHVRVLGRHRATCLNPLPFVRPVQQVHRQQTEGADNGEQYLHRGITRQPLAPPPKERAHEVGYQKHQAHPKAGLRIPERYEHRRNENPAVPPSCPPNQPPKFHSSFMASPPTPSPSIATRPETLLRSLDACALAKSILGARCVLTSPFEFGPIVRLELSRLRDEDGNRHRQQHPKNAPHHDSPDRSASFALGARLRGRGLQCCILRRRLARHSRLRVDGPRQKPDYE